MSGKSYYYISSSDSGSDSEISLNRPVYDDEFAGDFYEQPTQQNNIPGDSSDEEWDSFIDDDDDANKEETLEAIRELRNITDELKKGRIGANQLQQPTSHPPAKRVKPSRRITPTLVSPPTMPSAPENIPDEIYLLPHPYKIETYTNAQLELLRTIYKKEIQWRTVGMDV